MEQIQLRAKQQLLNIDNTQIQMKNQDFFVQFLDIKEKPLRKLQIKTSTSNSSHQLHPKIHKENSKQLLKNTLKRLLQTENLSPKTSLQQINTLETVRTSKHSKTSSKIPTFNSIEKTSRITQIQKMPILSFFRQNPSNQTKRNITFELKESNQIKFFQEQNKQIRKFIKKKMEQKNQQKQSKILPLTNTIENVKKFKTLIYDKINLKENRQESLIIKQRSKKRISQKISLKQISNLENQSSDKQNLDGVSIVSDLHKINNKKTNGYEGRKLRNILF